MKQKEFWLLAFDDSKIIGIWKFQSKIAGLFSNSRYSFQVLMLNPISTSHKRKLDTVG